MTDRPILRFERALPEEQRFLMSDEPVMCDECGETASRIQCCNIAWPNQRHIQLWLHPQCEQTAIERLERTKR